MLLHSLLPTLALLSSRLGVEASPARSLFVPKGFVRPFGQEFLLDDEKFYFAGANSYWISFTAELSDVSKTLDEAKSAGLRVVRTWGFNDKNVTFIPDGLPQYGGEGAGPSDIVYQWWANGTSTISTFGTCNLKTSSCIHFLILVLDTDPTTGLGRFDSVVKLAEQKGLKLIVTLTNNCERPTSLRMNCIANGVKLWVGADYGGMDVYTVNLGGQYHDDFYTSPKIIAAYKVITKPENLCGLLNIGCHRDTSKQWSNVTSPLPLSLLGNSVSIDLYQ